MQWPVPRSTNGVDRLSPRLASWLCLVAAVVAGGATLVASRHGPGLSFDSVTYLVTGQNLADGRGLVTLDDAKLTIFPPGLPGIVAAAEALAIDVHLAMRLLMALCSAAIVVIGHSLLRPLVGVGWICLVGTMLIGMSPALLAVTQMVWTEAPFAVVVLLTLDRLGRVWRKSRISPTDALLIAALGSVAFYLRYAGVALIATSSLVVLVTLWGRSRRDALVGSAAVTAMSMAAPALWVIRNRRVDGTLFGPRSGSGRPALEVVVDLFAGFGSWLIPISEVSRGVRALLGLVALGGLAVLVVGAWRVRRTSMSDGAESGPAPSVPSELGPLVVFVGVYTPYIVASQLATVLDPIDGRLLSPILVPVILIGCWLVHDARNRFGAHERPRVARAVLVLALTVLIFQPLVLARDVRAGFMGGVGYNGRSWATSPLALSVRDQLIGEEGVVLYSNVPEGLWSATGLAPIYRTPRGFHGYPVEAGALERWAEDVGCAPGRVIVAWFDRAPIGTVGVEALGEAVVLEPVLSTEDGTVLEVIPHDDPTACPDATNVRPVSR